MVERIEKKKRLQVLEQLKTIYSSWGIQVYEYANGVGACKRILYSEMPLSAGDYVQVTRSDLVELSELVKKSDCSENQEDSALFLSKLKALSLKDEHVVLEKLSVSEFKDFNADAFVGLNYRVDSVVRLVFSTLYPLMPSARDTDYQIYAGHKIIMTSSSVGKTSIANRFGRVLQGDQASPACLLGFSTADSMNVGALADQTQPFFLDEMSEDDKESAWSAMLTLMRQGIVTVYKGKKPLLCRSLSSIVFMGNEVRNSQAVQNGVQQSVGNYYVENPAVYFQNFLLRLSKNDALGSREGVLLLGTDFKRAERLPAEKNFSPLDEKMMLTQRKAFGYYLGRLMLQCFAEKSVVNWLNQKHPVEYVAACMNLASKMRFNPLVSGFVSNHAQNSYTHTRGDALRLAVLKLHRKCEKAVDYPKIIEEAEKQYATLLAINLRSLGYLAGEMQNNQHYERILADELIARDDLAEIAFIRFLAVMQEPPMEWKWHDRVDALREANPFQTKSVQYFMQMVQKSAADLAALGINLTKLNDFDCIISVADYGFLKRVGLILSAEAREKSEAEKQAS